MFSSIFKISALAVGLFLSLSAHALNTAQEEAACLEIGFKKKTEAYGNCVLELIERKASSVESATDPDDATCRKYGFKPKSNEYASCRLQIDQAKQDAQRQQAQYLEQQRQYEAKAAEHKRQADKQKSLALLQMGLGMMAGGSNSGNNFGPAPIAPTAPQNLPRTYMLPGNRTMTCTTTGNITNCF